MKVKSEKQKSNARKSKAIWSSQTISATKLKMTRGGNKCKAFSPKGGIQKDKCQDHSLEEMDGDGIDWDSIGNRPSQNNQSTSTNPIIAQLNQSTRERMSEHMSTSKSKGAESVIDILNERASVRGSMAGSQSGGTLQVNDPTSMGEQTFFRTPKPEGSMRDVVIVEIRTLNDEPFRGTLTYTEACTNIFVECLGLDATLIHGVKFAFSNYPVIRFKLNEQIDVDELYDKESFEFRRSVKKGNSHSMDILACKIKGIRNPLERIRGNARYKEQESEQDPNLRWVTIEGADYGLEETEILDWLKLYGETFGKLHEDIHGLSGSGQAPIGNGNYSIKMRLDKPIPNLLPIYGKKITVYFKGIQKLCSNCYGAHHRLVCKSRKLQWINYVRKFMEDNPNIPDDLYGKWAEIISGNIRPTVTGSNPAASEVPQRQRYRGNQPGEVSQGQQRNHEVQNRYHKPMWQEHQINYHKPQGNSQQQYQNPEPRSAMCNQDQALPNCSRIENVAQEHRQSISTKAIAPQLRNQGAQSQYKLGQVMRVYADLDDVDRLVELTELGLTFDAARDLLKQEKEVEAIKNLIREKNNQKQKQHLNDQNEREFFTREGQGGQAQHKNGKPVNSRAYQQT